MNELEVVEVVVESYKHLTKIMALSKEKALMRCVRLANGIDDDMSRELIKIVTGAAIKLMEEDGGGGKEEETAPVHVYEDDSDPDPIPEPEEETSPELKERLEAYFEKYPPVCDSGFKRPPYRENVRNCHNLLASGKPPDRIASTLGMNVNQVYDIRHAMYVDELFTKAQVRRLKRFWKNVAYSRVEQQFILYRGRQLKTKTSTGRDKFSRDASIRLAEEANEKFGTSRSSSGVRNKYSNLEEELKSGKKTLEDILPFERSKVECEQEREAVSPVATASTPTGLASYPAPQ